MGSYMTQQVLFEEPSLVDAAVLSGTSGEPDLLASAGRVVARAERLRLGERGKSALLTKLSFGAFNQAFAPNRTSFDWLSRDPAEVDAYIADPLCGFECTTTLWVQLLDALPRLALPSNHARIPKSLPVYVFAGAEDPVGGFSKSVRKLLDAYRTAGLRDVTFRFYAGGRHEMINETNRDDVVRDLRTWLDGKLPARATAA
jgi:alpha-beta hydrolase superfamily lysophospholipase